MNQGENLSEIEPPLGTQTTPPFTRYTASAAVAVDAAPSVAAAVPPPSCNSDTGGHRVHECDLKSHCLCATQCFKKAKICQKIDSIHDITNFSEQFSKISLLVEICQN